MPNGKVKFEVVISVPEQDYDAEGGALLEEVVDVLETINEQLASAIVSCSDYEIDNIEWKEVSTP